MQAVVTYESGKKSGDLPPELHRLGKALARGSNFKALADAAMESPNLKEAIKGRICSDISKECKRLCSKADPSLLRGMTKEAMVNFSWQAVGKYLQTKAPLFLRCILAAADPANGTATTYDAVRHPGVYTAAAILLKKRDKAISLIPYVISTILKVGKTSKTVRSKTKLSPSPKGMEFPGGGGSGGLKNLKKCKKLHWNFQRGREGGGGVKQNLFCRGSIDIFWNYTLGDHLCRNKIPSLHSSLTFTLS